MLFSSNDIAFQETFGNDKTADSFTLFCCLQCDDLGRYFLNEARRATLGSGSSAFLAVEFVSRLHNHNNLRKSFVLLSANQIQGHFVGSRFISSKITIGLALGTRLGDSFLDRIHIERMKVNDIPSVKLTKRGYKLRDSIARCINFVSKHNSENFDVVMLAGTNDLLAYV